MACFIKTETFTEKTKQLPLEERKKHLKAHLEWVKQLDDLGIKVKSGFLVDDQKHPGGGGLLLIKAESFEAAKKIIKKDPMIVAGLVDWNLKEWVSVYGELI